MLVSKNSERYWLVYLSFTCNKLAIDVKNARNKFSLSLIPQVEEVDNRYSMRMQGLMSDNTDLR